MTTIRLVQKKEILEKAQSTYFAEGKKKKVKVEKLHASKMSQVGLSFSSSDEFVFHLMRNVSVQVFSLAEASLVSAQEQTGPAVKQKQC